jgi:hypothetical protein
MNCVENRPKKGGNVDICDKELMEHGRRAYGQAWLQTGAWIADNSHKLETIGSPCFGLIMIHHKAMRGLAADPTNDHFRDIVGYLTLLMNELAGAP